MSTVALCALLLAAAVGDGNGDEKRTRTTEEINDLNANNEVDDTATTQARDAVEARTAKERLNAARASQEDIDLRKLERFNADRWPAASRRAAADTISRFGEPDETTDDKLIWKDAGGFKKIMVSREGTAHRFPATHFDVLTYVVGYRVPPSRFDDLAYFDGSVHADRTKGELSARCDSHEMNIAALNLADDIIRGRRTVAQARANLTSVQKQVSLDHPPALARQLRFDATRLSTADPDRAANTAMGR